MSPRRLIGLVLICCGLLLGQARAAEEITDFVSKLVVAADGAMEVTEAITVVAEGRQIKRGIYRDFPTRYRSGRGEIHEVEFKLLEVVRDGEREAYRQEPLSNGVRIYIGSADRMLPPGEHNYTLRYRVARHLGHFETHDELYWNVTGNGWQFPIRHASARVILPAGVSSETLRFTAYTGAQGARGDAFEAAVSAASGVLFRSTAPLAAAEGLTVVVGWPKGHVTPPAPAVRPIAERVRPWIGHGALALLLGYYLIAWFAVGRDPRKGVIIPLWEPPDGLSPAAIRYVRERKADDVGFAAAVIDMAVKRYITLQRRRGSYTLTVADPARLQALTQDERQLAAQLLADDSISLVRKQHKPIGNAREALAVALTRAHAGVHFRSNRRYLLPGIGLALLSLVAIGYAYASDATAFGVIAAVSLPWLAAAAGFARARIWTPAAATAAAGAIGLVIMAFAESPALAGLLLLVAVLPAVFDLLLAAPTRGGRRLLDRIEGFRRYLHTAERDELKAFDPPEDTPELFERFLPYALALGVEQAWAERFAGLLAEAGEYHPEWYTGTGWRRDDFGRLASEVGGGFAGSISSAASPPGSSSGFSSSGSGGGGSSGGGGGGGGGGGW